MTRARNYHYHADPATITRLVEEYRFIGRDVDVPEPGHIVVLALPRKKVKQQDEKSEKPKYSRKNTYRASK